jgi:hypothetical protein
VMLLSSVIGFSLPRDPPTTPPRSEDDVWVVAWSPRLEDVVEGCPEQRRVDGPDDGAPEQLDPCLCEPNDGEHLPTVLGGKVLSERGRLEELGRSGEDLADQTQLTAEAHSAPAHVAPLHACAYGQERHCQPRSG